MQPHRSKWELAGTGAVLLAALLACKKKTQTEAVDAAPSAQAPVTAEPAPPPAATVDAEPVKRPVPVHTIRKADAGAKKADAGTSPAADAGAKPASSKADASAPSAAQAAACVQKCQGALQKCLVAPREGGLPSFANTKACADAFTACQAACTAK